MTHLSLETIQLAGGGESGAQNLYLIKEGEVQGGGGRWKEPLVHLMRVIADKLNNILETP